MIEKTWKTLGGERVELRSALIRELGEFPDSRVIIACDSQQVGIVTEYVTVVVLHRPTKGGRVFICHERIARVRELRERLWREVWRSAELAMELSSPTGDQPEIRVDEVHIDVNREPRYKSSQYVEELVGLVMGQGFKAVVKPEAFAASHIADHVVKHKPERRKPHSQVYGKRAA